VIPTQIIYLRQPCPSFWVLVVVVASREQSLQMKARSKSLRNFVGCGSENLFFMS
jgi:hypothetical protein